MYVTNSPVVRSFDGLSIMLQIYAGMLFFVFIDPCVKVDNVSYPVFFASRLVYFNFLGDDDNLTHSIVLVIVHIFED